MFPFNRQEHASNFRTLNISFCRLNTGLEGGSFAGLWTQSPAGSIYRTILEKNMDDSSYDDAKTSVKKVLNLPNEAYFGSFGTLLLMPNVHCKVNYFQKCLVGTLIQATWSEFEDGIMIIFSMNYDVFHYSLN